MNLGAVWRKRRWLFSRRVQYRLGVLGGAVVPAFLPLSGEGKKR